MAVNFSESMTKENLMRAFANRYTIAAERAEKEGMLTIAEIFRYTADQERAHAERFYDLLKDLSGETIHIDGSYPVDQQDSLTGLLRAAEHNEHEEFADVYQTFGKTAKEEGFSEAASAFFQIAEIEHIHEIWKNCGNARIRQLVSAADRLKMDVHKLRLYPRRESGASGVPCVPA